LKIASPEKFEDFIGQETIKANLKIFIQAAKKEMRIWIMFCCMDRPGWARPAWPI